MPVSKHSAIHAISLSWLPGFSIYFACLFGQFNPLKLWNECVCTELGAGLSFMCVPLCVWRGKERWTDWNIIGEICLTGNQNKIDPILLSATSSEFLSPVVQQWFPTFPSRCSHQEVITGRRARCVMEREVTWASESNKGCQNPNLGVKERSG